MAKTPPIDECYRIAIAADLCGVERSTLRSAVLRGDLPSDSTGCGLPTVTLAAVRAWHKAKSQRRPGPKPAKR